MNQPVSKYDKAALQGLQLLAAGLAALKFDKQGNTQDAFYDYDPNQARNERGEWTAGGGAAPAEGHRGDEPRGAGGGGAGLPQAPGKPTPAVSSLSRARFSDDEVARAEREQHEAAGGHQPLNGLPQKVMSVGGKAYIAGPLGRAQQAAQDYMRSAGLHYRPASDYVRVDPEKATRIAQAFDDMKHAPRDPEVAKAYDAMAKETIAQWHTIQKTGLKVHWMQPGEQPYKSPWEVHRDVRENNHMSVFPTEGGFGTGAEAEHAHVDNPMLADSGEVISGKHAVVNDVFRIVHDYFGHVKEGVGFRADGEDNAWRSHAAMYSPLARKAMTSETRGQNSWVNFGPHAQANKGASEAGTIYAPQKIGVMPDWTRE